MFNAKLLFLSLNGLKRKKCILSFFLQPVGSKCKSTVNGATSVSFPSLLKFCLAYD